MEEGLILKPSRPQAGPGFDSARRWTHCSRSLSISDGSTVSRILQNQGFVSPSSGGDVTPARSRVSGGPPPTQPLQSFARFSSLLLSLQQ